MLVTVAATSNDPVVSIVGDETSRSEYANDVYERPKPKGNWGWNPASRKWVSLPSDVWKARTGISSMGT